MRLKFKTLVFILFLFLTIIILKILCSFSNHSLCPFGVNNENTISESEVQDATTSIFNEKMKLRMKIINEFKKRRYKVRYMCNNMKDIKKKVIWKYQKAISNMIVDADHKLTWCPIYKAASSMWMKNFVILNGASLSKDFPNETTVEYSAIIKQKFQQKDTLVEKLKKMNSTEKFMIVRHPFERLLSAYRDKLEHRHNRQFYYMRYGKYIRTKFRKTKTNLTSLEPTFEEFLQFIVQEKYFDEHWAPFFDSCQPCAIHYNYIIKFEFLKDEYNVFITENNLDGYLQYAINNEDNTSSQGITNDLIAERYFRDIPGPLLLKIFKIYELDFLLFSYSPAKYYSMTRNK